MKNALREQACRRFAGFLAVFCVALVLTALLAVYGQAQAARAILLEREQTLAAGLLAEGVAPATLARAFAGQGTAAASAAGAAFLAKLGHTAAMPARLLPGLAPVLRATLAAALAAALLLGGTLLGAASMFFAGRERLYRQAVDRVARFAEGDFSGHMPRGQGGSLYELFGAVDGLAKALQAKGEEEHRAKQALKDSVSDISHQLKTPLAALTLYTEIITGDAEEPATVRDFAQKSMRSLARMEGLIQNLLKIMRLDAGSITFDKRPCAMAALAESAAADLRTRAAAEGKTLLVEGAPADTLLCDAAWTGEAVSNLIKNALDHTARGGTIRVGWQRTPAMLRLSVTDDGCGIAPGDLHHIFKRFYRSANSGDRQGAGLGLPLAKAIVEGQGGVLSVKSEPGRGSTFTVSFLLTEPTAQGC